MRFPAWTDKFAAKVYALAAGAFAFVGWLADLPPSQQTGVLGQISEIVPEPWKPAVNTTFHSLTGVLTVMAIWRASHAGPSSPPVNKPQ